MRSNVLIGLAVVLFAGTSCDVEERQEREREENKIVFEAMPLTAVEHVEKIVCVGAQKYVITVRDGELSHKILVFNGGTPYVYAAVAPEVLLVTDVKTEQDNWLEWKSTKSASDTAGLWFGKMVLHVKSLDDVEYFGLASGQQLRPRPVGLF